MSEGASMPALLRCEALRVGHRGVAILPALDLEILPGQLWLVLGHNGSGKSTLLRTLLGLTPPVSGRVVRGPDLALAHVPQRAALDALYPALARDVVAMGLERGTSFIRPLRGAAEAIARTLQRCGAAELAERPFRELSEGQKQRVLLARALVSNAALILLDEPESAMDARSAREALQLVDAARHEGVRAVLVVSHRVGELRGLADHAILLDAAGPSAVAGPAPRVFATDVYARAYGDGFHV